jgi:peptide/nickel transport system substrate-binding protein
LGKLLVEGSTVPDTAKREEIYHQAEQIVHDDVARIPVVWATTPVVFRSNVMGYQPVVFRSWYEYIWIDPSK